MAERILDSWFWINMVRRNSPGLRFDVQWQPNSVNHFEIQSNTCVPLIALFLLVVSDPHGGCLPEAFSRRSPLTNDMFRANYVFA